MAPRPQILTTIVTTAPAFPLMMAANLPSFAVRGQPLVGKVIGVNGAGGYSYAKTAGPAFFTVNSATGDCTGTVPSGQSSFDVTISVTDALAATVSHTYHITTGYTIEPPGGWTTSNTKTPNAITGQPYQFDVSKLLVSPTLPVTYSVTTGSLPTGITFPTSTNPVLTATSVSGTTQSFSVTAADSAGNVTIIPLTISVGPALSLAITALPQAVIGQPYYGKITASGGDGNYSYDIRATGAALPAWASLNKATGEITGTPDSLTSTSGVLNTQFRVTDSSGATALNAAKITVGSAITPAPKGRFITTDSDGSALAVNFLNTFLGDGSDGNFVCNGTNTCPGTILSGGVNLATRNLYLNTLTSVAGGVLDMHGYDLFILDTTVGWDVTNAPAGAVIANGGNANGLSASTSTAGSPLYCVGGRGGLAGTNSFGVNGNDGYQVQIASGGLGGGLAGNAGRGGNGTSGSSGTSGAKSNIVVVNKAVQPIYSSFQFGFPTTSATVISDVLWAGSGGASGSPGAGSGSAPGGNSGAGGHSGGRLIIRAGAITTSASTPAGVVKANGGNGGNATAGVATGCGGGGGGHGGGGGDARVYYGNLFGPTVANFIWTDGGNGGMGGASGGGSATAGVGGLGGVGGYAYATNILTGASSVSTGGATPTTPSTTAGSSGTTSRTGLV